MKGNVDVIVPLPQEFDFTLIELMEFIRKNENDILWDPKNQNLLEQYK